MTHFSLREPPTLLLSEEDDVIRKDSFCMTPVCEYKPWNSIVRRGTITKMVMSFKRLPPQHLEVVECCCSQCLWSVSKSHSVVSVMCLLSVMFANSRVTSTTQLLKLGGGAGLKRRKIVNNEGDPGFVLNFLKQ